MGADASRRPRAGTTTAADGAEVMRRAPFGDNPSVGVVGATTQRSILTVALNVFAEHGFHDTKVEHITAAAGCSRPAFYQYFASKQDVFWRLAGHLARELATVADHLGPVAPDATGVDTLAEWLDELIDLHEAYHPIFVSFPAAFREAEPDQPLPRSLPGAIEQVLRAADPTRAGRDDGEPAARAQAIATVVLRSVHYWLLGLFSIPRDRFTHALAATVHRLAHGQRPEVNAGPLVAPPPHAAPAWPSAPDDDTDRPLRARGVATRQKLLDAASRVLPRRGYHDTRVDDIAAEAGRSHGSFYRYFETTDHLFLELALDAGEQMAELVDSFSTEPGPPLHSWLTSWFATYRANGGVISAWQEIGLDSPAVSTLSQEIVLVFLDRLERLVATRGFGDTSVDAIVLLAVLERLPHGVVVTEESEEPATITAAQHIIERSILGT